MTLPANWQREPDAKLEVLFEDQRFTDAERDDIIEELELRHAMRSDERVAEANGAPWLRPS